MNGKVLAASDRPRGPGGSGRLQPATLAAARDRTVSTGTEQGAVTVETMIGMAETETGGVRVERTRGPVRVTTSAGDIEVVDLVPGFAAVTTDAGDVRIHNR